MTAIDVLEGLKKVNSSQSLDFLRVEVQDRNEISAVIDALRSKDIHIYQLSIKNNLEELFLSLTQN